VVVHKIYCRFSFENKDSIANSVVHTVPFELTHAVALQQPITDSFTHTISVQLTYPIALQPPIADSVTLSLIKALQD
jgi:uncharacterized membrane protein